jgi:Xaa-Pro aminopeptidase
VHDDCPYGAADGRGEVRLEAGMVLTVEPGCYVAPGTQGIDPRWHAIGVRIEDDVLVTADGNVVLSAALPKRIEEVEAVMAETSLYPTRADLEPRR